MIVRVNLSISSYVLLKILLVSANFDCDLKVESDDNICNNELVCIYDDDAFEEDNRSCTCKTTITALSLPTFTEHIFQKLCRKYKENVKKLEITDVELQYFDNTIFQIYPNLKYLSLKRNKIQMNFTQQAQNIIELDLSSNGLSDFKKDDFKYLKHLKMLNVSFNKLESINADLSGLLSLEELLLNNNKLKNFNAIDFNFLINLKILNLAFNSISVLNNNLMLLNLHTLFLNSNKLVSININYFRSVPNLRNLNLKSNLITNLQVETTINEKQEEKNKKIKNHNGFNFWSPQSNIHSNPFGNFFKNQQVSNNNFLNRNPFTTNLNISQNDLETKQQKPALFLIFGANPFTETTPKAVEMIQTESAINENRNIPWNKIQYLDLSQNHINSISEQFFENFYALQYLNISYNNISNFDPMWLRKSIKLGTFDIKNNLLNYLNLDFFTKLPLLKIIDFDVSLINCEQSFGILQNLKTNGVVLNNCNSASKCCGLILSTI